MCVYLPCTTRAVSSPIPYTTDCLYCKHTYPQSLITQHRNGNAATIIHDCNLPSWGYFSTLPNSIDIGDSTPPTVMTVNPPVVPIEGSLQILTTQASEKNAGSGIRRYGRIVARCLVNPRGRPEILPQSVSPAAQRTSHRHSPVGGMLLNHGSKLGIKIPWQDARIDGLSIVRAQQVIHRRGMGNIWFVLLWKSNTLQDWGQVDFTLYNETFAGRAKVISRCCYWLSEHHASNECALAPDIPPS